MRAWELKEENRIYYHGSMKYLPVGTILKPRDDYENDWMNTDFYKPLESYRPKDMLSHNESVFMVDNDVDLDCCGGGTDWVFILQPLGIVQRHDMNWSSEISMLVGDGEDISEKVRAAAENYWNGVPHYNESVWEYLTPAAKVINVEEY